MRNESNQNTPLHVVGVHTPPSLQTCRPAEEMSQRGLERSQQILYLLVCWSGQIKMSKITHKHINVD